MSRMNIQDIDFKQANDSDKRKPSLFIFPKRKEVIFIPKYGMGDVKQMEKILDQNLIHIRTNKKTGTRTYEYDPLKHENLLKQIHLYTKTGNDKTLKNIKKISGKNNKNTHARLDRLEKDIKRIMKMLKLK